MSCKLSAELFVVILLVSHVNEFSWNLAQTESKKAENALRNKADKLSHDISDNHPSLSILIGPRSPADTHSRPKSSSGRSQVSCHTVFEAS